MRSICVYPHPNKPEAARAALRTVDLLRGAGIEALPPDAFARADAVIALGGDGTFLRAQRFCAQMGIPVLCVNLGRMGFLSEVEACELDDAVARLVAGDYAIASRMMLSCACGGRSQIALNDIVIHRGQSQRLIRFDIYVDDELMDAYAADGIALSSPTGSTAYALSAGGPVVFPDMACLIAVAIAPHTLRARPVLIPEASRVRVVITAAPDGALVSADGQIDAPLTEGDTVTITRADIDARFIRIRPHAFYSRLRAKLVEWSS